MTKKKKDAAEEFKNVPEKKVKKKQNDVASTTRAITIDKARNYLTDNYDFRYNIMANDIEFKLKKEKTYIKWNDRDFASININLDLQGTHIPENKLKQLLGSVYISETYDPIKDYIYSLPKWNKKRDHIKEFIAQIHLVNEKDRGYVLEGFTKWFVAFVMSFLNDEPEPFYINQVALIILGKKQGRLKSTWLGSMIPRDLRLKYYYPNSFAPHNKDHLKYLATKMLINLDEMESYNKTDIGVMKSIITTSQVALRLPYGRTDIEMKRRASFCGSINDRQFLRDETGSRRWFVVEVDRVDYNNNYDVSGMYAQALHLYKNEFKYWFDGTEINEMEKRNAEYTQLSMEEELLLQTFERPDEDEAGSQVLTTSQIASLIAKDNERMNINNSVIKLLGKALTKHNFERISFRQTNCAYNIYGWKVKPSVLGINKEKVGNAENDLF